MAVYDTPSYAEPAVGFLGCLGDITRISRKKTFATSITLTDGDTVRGLKIPRGAKILDAWIVCDDLDGGTEALVGDLHITDGTTTKKLITSSQAGRAATLFDKMDDGAAGFNYVTTNGDFYLEYEVTTTAGGAVPVANNGIQLGVKYTMLLEGSEGASASSTADVNP